MNAVSREAFRTMDVSIADLEPDFRLSFPDVLLPEAGARPLSVSDLRPLRRLRPNNEVKAREAESLDVPARRSKSRGRLLLVLALLVLPTVGAVSGFLSAGNVAVEEVIANVERLASSATASMAKGLEGVTSAAALE